MRINGSNYKTIWFDPDEKNVKIIDQTLLPFQFKIISLKTFDDIVNAIKTMQVRGAPLIGATAAFGMYFASLTKEDPSFMIEKGEELKKSRPTAVNLAWAVHRITKLTSSLKENFQSKVLEECEKNLF